MKTTLRYIAAAILTLTITGSCSHKFEEYNTDPNNMDMWKVPAAHLLADVIFKGADGYLYRTWQINGELMQYTVQMYTENIHRYIIRESYVSGAWNALARWAAAADHMAEVAELKEDDNSLAIALTMRALYMADLVSVWGDVPFSEAFAGRDEKPNTKPRFDEQKAVFTQLLADLERANSLYHGEWLEDGYHMYDKTVREQDLLYNGEIAKWKKFTNSLHLRLLTRLLNRDDEMNVSTKIREMLDRPSTYPVFENNKDNATLYFSGISPFRNRFGSDNESNFTSNARKMSDFFITQLRTTGDPRIGIFAKQLNNEWTGLVSGYPPTETVSTGCANLNKDVLGDYDSPYSFMRYDELLFIKAEMAHRGIISGGDNAAREYYNAGILASIEHWDEINPSTTYKVTDAQKEQFLVKVYYNNDLEQIMTQKYVALFWCGYEAYNDYRRTGYPRLPIGTGTSNNGILPTRLFYPVLTTTTNKEHYLEAAERMGGDNMKTPLWWSLAATAQ